MNEQMTMGIFLDLEKDVYCDLLPELKSVIETNWVSLDDLSFDKRKTFSAISYRGSVVARINFGETKATSYIELPEKTVLKFVPSNCSYKTQGGMARFLVSAKEEILSSYRSMILQALDDVISQYPKGFDCCSRYESCSNAGHCIHPDRNFAADCGYRKILKSGKVFYGKNRNV